MGTLRTELDRIASSFVSSVLDAMRSASLSDLADHTSGNRAAASFAPTRGRGRPRGGRPATVAAAAVPPGRAGVRRLRRASPGEVANPQPTALTGPQILQPRIHELYVN